MLIFIYSNSGEKEVQMKLREMIVYRLRRNDKDFRAPMIIMLGKWLYDMETAISDRVSVTLQDRRPVVEGTGRVWSELKGIGAVAKETGIYNGEAV